MLEGQVPAAWEYFGDSWGRRAEGPLHRTLDTVGGYGENPYQWIHGWVALDGGRWR
jgi:hypothetical protein